MSTFTIIQPPYVLFTIRGNCWWMTWGFELGSTFNMQPTHVHMPRVTSTRRETGVANSPDAIPLPEAHRLSSGNLLGEKAKTRRQLKAFKVKENKAQMVLGLELTLDKVVGMHKRTLIGRLEYCKLSEPEMKKWMHLNWELVIGYTPRFSVLMKGWFSEEDASQVIKRF